MSCTRPLSSQQLAERIGAPADWVEHYAGPPSSRIDGQKRIRPQDIAAWRHAWETIPSEPLDDPPLGGAR
jgi:hypothetical protein